MEHLTANELESVAFNLARAVLDAMPAEFRCSAAAQQEGAGAWHRALQRSLETWESLRTLAQERDEAISRLGPFVYPVPPRERNFDGRLVAIGLAMLTREAWNARPDAAERHKSGEKRWRGGGKAAPVGEGEGKAAPRAHARDAAEDPAAIG